MAVFHSKPCFDEGRPWLRRYPGREMGYMDQPGMLNNYKDSTVAPLADAALTRLFTTQMRLGFADKRSVVASSSCKHVQCQSTFKHMYTTAYQCHAHTNTRRVMGVGGAARPCRLQTLDKKWSTLQSTRG